MVQVMGILKAPDVIGLLDIEILLMLGILTVFLPVYIIVDMNNLLVVPFVEYNNFSVLI